MITLEQLYDRTNRGLDIITYYYPQAIDALEAKKPFSIRDEKTPSTYIKEIKGVFKITDFGDDGRGQSPLDVAMSFENKPFFETLLILSDRYNIENTFNPERNKPDIRKRAATPDEIEMSFTFELNETISENELKVLGPKITSDHCKRYGFYSVKSYSKVKDREIITISSNENYPIFMRECTYDKEGEIKTFHKIYQPCNPDKSYRFFYNGEKQNDYINGLKELKKAYTEYNQQQEKQHTGAGGDPNDYKQKKLSEVVICSGERDAINAVSMGVCAIWFNSESYQLSEKEYKEIMKYTERLYNIPDIDTTGVRKGIDLGLKYLEIQTVWLPDWLKKYKDQRGRPRKDFRDFVELRRSYKDFNDLLRVAMPMRFWETVMTEKGERTEINVEYLLHFLWANGFGTIENKTMKNEMAFVRINNNVVSEVKAKDIRTFLRQFMIDNHFDIKLRNLVNNSKRITESIFELMKPVPANFRDYEHDRQYLFFKDSIWEISPTDVKVFKSELDRQKINRSVFADEVINKEVKRIEPSFTASLDTTGAHDFNILHQQSNFFKYLINTSRVHWRCEYEERINRFDGGLSAYLEKYKYSVSGELLTDEEIAEQKQHLLNKIFAIGYLLHRHRRPDRSWCVFAMDNKVSEDGESNGGSGKSFCFKSISICMKSVTLQGRNPKLTDNMHIFERVSEYTDFVLIDDAAEYLDFNRFFDSITGNVEVNPKHASSYEIPFESAPKFCITTNYTIKRNDSSKERRLLYTVFSDYYHQRTDDNNYLETRSIHDDFGFNLMDELYPAAAWNADINFFVDCLQFYLSTVREPLKLQPPMGRVIERTLISNMSENFKDWAEVYFAPEGNHLNNFIERATAFNDFVRDTGQNKWTMKKFSSALKSFCKWASWIEILNPVEYRNTAGRIIRKNDTDKSAEFIYIKTPGHEIDLSLITQKMNEDEMPF